jgi:hypothetical protein
MLRLQNKRQHDDRAYTTCSLLTGTWTPISFSNLDGYTERALLDWCWAEGAKAAAEATIVDKSASFIIVVV